MNVWKIASRWSDKGTPESTVLDIFRKYQVLFAGRERDYIKNYVKVYILAKYMKRSMQPIKKLDILYSILIACLFMYLANWLPLLFI